jgi:hypothetical protein
MTTNTTTPETTLGAPATATAAPPVTPAAGVDATAESAGTPAASEAKPTEAPPAPAAEEITYTAPEGFELPEADVKAFDAIVKDSTLTRAQQAQKLIDLAAARETARAAEFQATVAGWVETVKADPELGKDENQAAARKVVQEYGSDEFRALLNSSGMGNHPEVVRFVLNISKRMGEDSVIRSRGDSPAPRARDYASVLYDKSPSK